MESVRKLKASIFQGLAHPTRLAIVELLTQREMSVGEIMHRLRAGQPTISQHLAILRAKRIVAGRKEGNQVLYSLRDPALKRVLDLMRRYTMKHLAEDVSLLAEMEDEGR